MAEVSGKRRELLLDIGPFAIPAEKRSDGEAVTKVVHARPGVIVRASQTNLARQTPEDTMHILMQQATTALGNEEMLAAVRAKMIIASFGVAAECRAGDRAQSLVPGVRVADVARRHEVTRWQVYDWHKKLKAGVLALSAETAKEPMFAALVVDPNTINHQHDLARLGRDALLFRVTL